MIDFADYNLNDDDILNRISDISEVSMLKSIDPEILRSVIGMIDLTTLEGNDTDNKIEELCKLAYGISNPANRIPSVAAVCMYPVFVSLANRILKDKYIKIASVAGAFPSGQTLLKIKVDEVRYAVDQGADEIDTVISRGKLIEKEYNFVLDELLAIREACKDVHLKVILETGELPGIFEVRKASEIAINSGADFIKTSTGKIQPAATPIPFMVMLDTIKEYYDKTGKKIGIKPAGGISESKDATFYYSMVEMVLGHSWLTKNLFRIGASRLLTNVLSDIKV